MPFAQPINTTRSKEYIEALKTHFISTICRDRSLHNRMHRFAIDLIDISIYSPEHDCIYCFFKEKDTTFSHLKTWKFITSNLSVLKEAGYIDIQRDGEFYVIDLSPALN